MTITTNNKTITIVIPMVNPIIEAVDNNGSVRVLEAGDRVDDDDEWDVRDGKSFNKLNRPPST